MSSVTLSGWCFMVLTAARPSEAFNAQWSEIDWDERLWVVPAARMKGAKQHIVPLSDEALAILERQYQPSVRSGAAIFPGRSGSPPSYSSFADAPMKAGIDAATPHGWRSIFRGWAGNIAEVEFDLAEAALAHSLSKVAGSYWRESRAVERRRKVMQSYGDWLSGAQVILLEDHRASPTRREA